MGGSEPRNVLCSGEAEEGGRLQERGKEGKERGGVFQSGLHPLGAQQPLSLLGLLPPPLKCAELPSVGKRSSSPWGAWYPGPRCCCCCHWCCCYCSTSGRAAASQVGA